MKQYKNKTNKLLTMGLLANAIFLIINPIQGIPELIKGMLVGIALMGMLLGSYGQTHDVNKLAEWKKDCIATKKDMLIRKKGD